MITNEDEKDVIPWADEPDFFPETGDVHLDEWLRLFYTPDWTNPSWFEKILMRDGETYLDFITPFAVDHPASKVMPLGGWLGPASQKILNGEDENNNVATIIGLALCFGWRPKVLSEEDALSLLTDVLVKGRYEQWGGRYETLLSHLVLGKFIPRDEVIGISLMRGFEVGRRYPKWNHRLIANIKFFVARFRQFLGKTWYRAQSLLK